MDLIDRKAAIDALRDEFKRTLTNAIRAMDTIKNMPSAQAERPKGRWIPQNHNKVNGMTSTAVYYYPKCSVCGHCANYTDFCPACGADMRGETNE